MLDGGFWRTRNLRLQPYTEQRSAWLNYSRLHATRPNGAQFHDLFVNRRAYTLQSMKAAPGNGAGTIIPGH